MIAQSLTLIGLLASSTSAGRDAACARLDSRLIYCPSVQAPRITELKEGFVVLGFTIRRDGSVEDVHVLNADHFGQWNEAAVRAVLYWRYKPSGRTERKSLRLHFNLNGG